jgi:hypothetical protein
MRVLLNKKIEPLQVDLRKSASGLCDGVGSTGPLFNHRCLADNGAFLLGFDVIINRDVALRDS